MDDDLLQAITQDLHDAVGYRPIPEHAVQIPELMRISGLSYEFTRRAVKDLVEKGAWKKGRRGNKTFYWKIQGGKDG